MHLIEWNAAVFEMFEWVAYATVSTLPSKSRATEHKRVAIGTLQLAIPQL